MIRKIYYLLILILLLGSGCARYKNIAYIQDRYDVTDSTKLEISVAEGGNLELRPGDNVYINVYGLEFNQLESFNKSPCANEPFVSVTAKASNLGCSSSYTSSAINP